MFQYIVLECYMFIYIFEFGRSVFYFYITFMIYLADFQINFVRIILCVICLINWNVKFHPLP